MKIAVVDIRTLYSEACHGAGAGIRRAARTELEAEAHRVCGDGAGWLRDFFERHGLELSGYFASRPIA
jgi:hypothetical protein